MRKEDGRKDSENSWVEFNTPTRDGRRIVEGCALVPPRQFIRTLGGYFAALGCAGEALSGFWGIDSKQKIGGSYMVNT